jgi:hypothetical protein
MMSKTAKPDLATAEIKLKSWRDVISPRAAAAPAEPTALGEALVTPATRQIEAPRTEAAAPTLEVARRLLDLIGDKAAEVAQVLVAFGGSAAALGRAMLAIIERRDPAAPEAEPSDAASESEDAVEDSALRRRRAQKPEPRQVPIKQAIEEAFGEFQLLATTVLRGDRTASVGKEPLLALRHHIAKLEAHNRNLEEGDDKPTGAA